MRIELEYDRTHKIAQTVHIGPHSLVADVDVAGGGDSAGPSPHALYDAALGACKALTLMWYARRKGIPVDDVRVAVDRDDSQERAGVYKLKAALQVSGDLTDAQLRELTTVAEKCPVHKLMTAVTTEITTSVERAA